MNHATHLLLAKNSVRQLFKLRHDPRHGEDAKINLKKWVEDIRRIENLILNSENSK